MFQTRLTGGISGYGSSFVIPAASRAAALSLPLVKPIAALGSRKSIFIFHNRTSSFDRLFVSVRFAIHFLMTQQDDVICVDPSLCMVRVFVGMVFRGSVLSFSAIAIDLLLLSFRDSGVSCDSCGCAAG
jgi:hypothetical protein